MSKITTFDPTFYLETYLDLGEEVQNEKDAIRHYIKHGILEQRSPSLDAIQHAYSSNIKQIQKENNMFQTNIRFNILIRTSKRPQMFKRCIESILSQIYKNYHVYVCYDTKDSLHYLKKYEKNAKITYFYNQSDSSEKYRFNLHCNALLQRVSSDYILFMDDDGMFTGNYCLNIIRCNISPYKLLSWTFLRPDKLVAINNRGKQEDIRLGEIDTSSVCFHHSLKHLSSWDDQQYGDYRFFKPLFRECPSESKMVIPYTLTSTQFDDKIGNYGT